MLHAVYGAWVQSLWAQLWSKFIGCHQKRQHRRAESGQVWCQAKLSRHNMTTWDPKIWDENSFGKCVYWDEDIEALVSQYNAGSSYRFINFLTGHQTNSCSTSECMLGLSEASALWQKMWQNIKVTERHGRFVWILPGKPSSAACRGGGCLQETSRQTLRELSFLQEVSDAVQRNSFFIFFTSSHCIQ